VRAPTAPGGFATEGRSFQLPAVSGPNAPGRARRTGAGSPCKTPGNWKLRASFAKPPCGGCDQPPPALSPQRRPQFPTAGRLNLKQPNKFAC